MFLRGTMVLSATGDEYCRRGDEAFGDLPNTVKVVDDVLQFDDDFACHVEGTCHLLQRCREANITLGLDKFVFAVAEVRWAGYIVGENGSQRIRQSWMPSLNSQRPLISRS